MKNTLITALALMAVGVSTLTAFFIGARVYAHFMGVAVVSIGSVGFGVVTAAFVLVVGVVTFGIYLNEQEGK